MGSVKDTNPRDIIDGVYIRNLSAEDNYRLRIPKDIIFRLHLQCCRKLAIYATPERKIIMAAADDDEDANHLINGVYIRNLSAEDNYRIRIPKDIIEQLQLQDCRKLAIHINRKHQIILEPHIE